MLQRQSALKELRRQELIAQRISAIDRRISELEEPLSPTLEPLMSPLASALSSALSPPPHPPNLSFEELVEERGPGQLSFSPCNFQAIQHILEDLDYHFSTHFRNISLHDGLIPGFFTGGF